MALNSKLTILQILTRHSYCLNWCQCYWFSVMEKIWTHFIIQYPIEPKQIIQMQNSPSMSIYWLKAFVHLPIKLINPIINNSIHSSIHIYPNVVSVHPTINIPFHPAYHPFLHPYTYPSLHKLIHLSIHPSINFINHVYMYLSNYLSIHPTRHPSTQLSTTHPPIQPSTLTLSHHSWAAPFLSWSSHSALHSWTCAPCLLVDLLCRVLWTHHCPPPPSIQSSSSPCSSSLSAADCRSRLAAPCRLTEVRK